MVDGPRIHEPGTWLRIIRREGEQLTLPLDVPGMRQAQLLHHARDFATGFGPRLGSKFLMRIGTPAVAATTPAVIRLIDKGWEDEWAANMLVGSALGGGWGAAVGALIPRNGDGVRVSRIRSAGTGAAGGVLLAPAVALASKWVADLITSPLERARDEAKDEAAEVTRELEREQAQQRGAATAGD